jgi:PKD repeat protein
MVIADCGAGQKDTNYITVTVNPIPNSPPITVTNNNTCGGTSMSFSTPAQAGVSFAWGFGDATAANGASVTHIYNPSPGDGNQSFTASVVATNSFGCSNSTSQVITVKQRPDASISDFTSDVAFTNCGNTDFDLIIDNTSTTTATNSLYQINWGDGSPVFSTANLPSTGTTHTYTSQGYFTLTLTVTGLNGCISTKTYSVYNGGNPAVGLGNPGATVELCLPFSLTFPITGTSSNPAGTTYTITTNTGAPSVTYSHPPPASYTHVFNTTSCGATGANTPNSFYVRIKVENPCGFSESTVSPITTASKPVALFSVSPDSIACVNSLVTFTNLTTPSILVTNNGVCDGTTKINWLISPGTGWAVSTGTLGNASPNINNPATWGSNALGVTFSVPGQYVITLITAGKKCGNDTLRKTICIQGPPAPSFTATPLIGCTPLVSNFTNTSTGVPTCGPTIRLWVVTKTSSNCIADSTSDYTFISGTNSSSVNPVIRFNNQGTYNVTLSLTNRCGTFISTPTTFTVKRKPQVAITIPPNICAGQTLSATSTVTNCADNPLTYLWSFAGGTPASSTLATPPPISFSTSGSHLISLSVTNECGTGTVSSSVNVLTIPIANAGTDKQICSGASTTLGSASTAGLTYQWSPTTGLSSSTISNPTVTISNGGISPLVSTYSLTVTNAANCSATDVVDVTVNPIPAMTNTTSVTICSGGSLNIPLTSTVASAYSWMAGDNPSTAGESLTAQATSTINNTITNSTATSQIVTYSVTPVSSAGSCTGSSQTITVTVLPVPVVTSATTATICSGNTLNVSITSNVTSTYSWIATNNANTTGESLTAQSTGVINNTIINNTSNNQTVNYSITPTSTTGSCLGNSQALVVTVNPSPTMTSAVSASVCSGTSLNIPLSSDLPSTYSWVATDNVNTTGESLTAQSGSSINNTVINNSATAQTINYSITPVSTAGSCAGTPQIVAVTINPAPTMTSASSATICSGASVTIPLTSNMTSTYTWIAGNNPGTNGESIALQNSGTLSNTITNSTQTVQTVTYTVTPNATAGSCVGNTQTVTVDVIPVPTMTNAATATICSGAALNISLTSNIPSAYTWIASDNASTSGESLTLQTTGIINNTIINNTAAVQTVTYTATPTSTTGTCSGTPQTIIVTVNPAPAMTSATSATICSGGSLNIPLTSDLPSTYVWIAADNINTTGESLLIQNSNLINNTILNNTASAQILTYSVTPTSSTGACIGAQQIVSVTVNPAPTMTSVSSATICSGASVNIPLTSNMPSTYTWIAGDNPGTNGESIVIQNSGTLNNTITNNTQTVQTVTYTVTPNATAGSCVGNTQTVIVDVIPVPTMTNAATATICSGAALNISLASNIPSAYSWIASDNAGTSGESLTLQTTGIINNTIINNTATVQTVTYTATPTSTTGTCSGIPQTIIVTVNPAPAMTSATTATICSGESLNISLTSDLPSTYTWIATDNINTTGEILVIQNSGLINNTIINNTSSAQILTYSVTPTSSTGACIGSSQIVTVTVNPTPVMTPPASVTQCAGVSTSAIIFNSNPGGTSYNWTNSNTSIGLAANGVGNITSFTTSNLTNAAISGTISVTSTLNGCVSSPSAFTITVNPIPTATASPGNSTICSGIQTNINIASNVAGTTFSWTANSPASVSGAANGNGNSIQQTLSNTSSAIELVTYIIVPTANNCIGSPIIDSVFVNPGVTISFSPSSQTLCSNQTSQVVTISSATTGLIYSWTAQANGAGGVTGSGSNTIPPQVLTNSTNSPIQVVYSTTATFAGCPTPPFLYSITVNPLPSIVLPANQTVCSSVSTAAVNISSPVAGTTFTWTATSTNGITGFPANGSSSSIPAFIPNNPGNTAGTIDYTITPIANNCPGLPVNYTYTVNPIPVISSIPSQTICSGQTTTMVSPVSAVAGSTFSWSSATGPNISGNTVSGAGNIPPETLNNSNAFAETATYTIISNANNCTSSSTFIVNVNPSPAAAFSIAPQIICSGENTQQVNLSSGTPGASISWNATIPPGISGGATSGTTTIPQQTLINSTNQPLTIIYDAQAATTGTAICPGTTTTYSITINPTPDVIVTPGQTTICSGIQTNISLTSNVAGTTFSWTVSAPSTITGASNGSGNTIQQTLSNNDIISQNVTYTIIPSANNCPGNPVTVTITVHPVPTINFSPVSQALCSGETSQVVTVTSPTTGVSFNWTASASSGSVNGFTTNGSGNLPAQTLFNSSTSIQTVDYIVDAGFSGCPGLSNTYTITIHPLPIVNFTFDSIDCVNVPLTFTVNPALANNYTWDFGDGNTTGNTTGNAIHTYSLSGNYNISLIEATAFGCIDSLSKSIEIIDPPTADFTTLPDSGCAPLNVAFVNNSTGSYTSFNWDFGNGNSTILFSPLNQTYQQGLYDTTYQVELTVTNQCGVSTLIKPVVVKPKPVVSLGTNFDSGCSPFHLIINNTSTGNATQYIMDFGDGSPLLITPTRDSISHLYYTGTQDTTYTITLIGINSCGNDTITKTILVHPHDVIALFNTSSVSGCAPYAITFTDASSGATFTSWDFGDGNVSTTLSVTHTYQNPGTYTCYEYVNNGCSYDTTSVTITIHPSPTLSFTSDGPSACVNQPVAFTNTSSNSVNYSWNFGDGTYSYLTDPIHNYSSAGTYIITLTGTSAVYGCIDSVSHSIIIDSLPVPQASSSVLFGCAPLNVAFTNTSTNSNFYSWNFGDGNTSSTPSPSNLFVAPGIYNVQLIAVNLNNCKDSIQLQINVNPKPVAAFSMSSTYSCSAPAPVIFTNNSTGAVGYLWDFGNGTTSTMNNPSVTYSTFNQYPISLVASNIYGCKDTVTDIYNVYQPLVASFSSDVQSGCEPLNVTFTPFQSGNIYNWNFGDSTFSNANIPSHIYPNAGNYYVSVTVTSSSTPCTSSYTITNPIKVLPTPTAEFNATQIYVDGLPDGTMSFQNLSIDSTLINSYYWNFGDGMNSLQTHPIHQYQGVGTYSTTLIAAYPNGCKDTIEHDITPDYFQGLFVPNAMVPLDATNEARLFLPKGRSIKKYHLQIFNTWGTLLFESTELDANGSPAVGWDGYFNGELCQQDVYVWKIEAIFMNGSVWQGKKYADGKIKPTGTVTLIK